MPPLKSYLIQGGTIYDGLGNRPRVADLRIENNDILAIGHLKPRKGEIRINARGLAVAPGFIDSHSHADGGIFEDPDAETQIRQGITTAVVGEDGSSSYPIRDFWDKLNRHPASIRFASFVGHGTVRSQVMGDAKRASTPAERDEMADMVKQEMRDGAIGLSSGLEYQPGRYGNVDELVVLAKAAAERGGMYISHVRNEDDYAFKAFDELVQIARRAHLPAEINHIKLGSATVWGKAGQVQKLMDSAKKEHLEIWADVYPYLYWQSTIRVIIATEQFDDRAQWEKGCDHDHPRYHSSLLRAGRDRQGKRRRDRNERKRPAEIRGEPSNLVLFGWGPARVAPTGCRQLSARARTLRARNAHYFIARSDSENDLSPCKSIRTQRSWSVEGRKESRHHDLRP